MANPRVLLQSDALDVDGLVGQGKVVLKANQDATAAIPGQVAAGLAPVGPAISAAQTAASLAITTTGIAGWAVSTTAGQVPRDPTSTELAATSDALRGTYPLADGSGTQPIVWDRQGAAWKPYGEPVASPGAVGAAILGPQKTGPYRVNQARGIVYRNGEAMPPAPNELEADDFNIFDDGYGNKSIRTRAGQIAAHEFDVYGIMQGTALGSDKLGKLADFAAYSSTLGSRSFLPRLADPRRSYRTDRTVAFSGEGCDVDWPGLVEPQGQIGGYLLDFTSGDISNRPWGPRSSTAPDGTTYARDFWQNRMRIHKLNAACHYLSLGVALRRWDHCEIGSITVNEANGHGIVTDGMREFILHWFVLRRCLGHNGRPAFDISDIAGGDANNTFFARGQILSAYECAVRVASLYRYAPESGAGQNPARFLTLDLHVEGNTGADYYDQVRTASSTAAAVDLVEARGVKLLGTYSGGQPRGEQCAIRVGSDTTEASHVVLDCEVFGNEGDGALVRAINAPQFDGRRARFTYLGGSLRGFYFGPLMTGRRALEGANTPQLVLATATARPGTLDGVDAEHTLDQYLGSVTRREVVGLSIKDQTNQELSARQGGLRTRFNAAGNAIPVTDQVQLYLADGPDLLRSPDQLSQNGWLSGIYGSLLRTAGALGSDGSGYYFTRTLADSRAAGQLAAASAGNPATWVPELPMSADTVYVLTASRASLGDDGSVVVAALQAVPTNKSPKNWVVLGLYPATSETVGSGTNTAILKINEALASWAGQRYIDVWGALRRYVTVLPHNSGEKPPEQVNYADMPLGQYYVGNGIDLNALGNKVVAQAVQDRLGALGM